MCRIATGVHVHRLWIAPDLWLPGAGQDIDRLKEGESLARGRRLAICRLR